MTDPGVEAHLEMTRQDRELSVRAYVTADTARPVRWRVVAASRTASGSTSVSQSGTSRGVADGPVGVIVVPADSQGSVTLTVFDGDRELVREVLDLSGPAQR